MRTSRWWLAIVTGGLVLGIATQLLAYPELSRETKVACEACHSNVAGGPDLTDAGKAYLADKTVPDGPAEGATFVGNKKCRMCHIKQHKAWGETAHAGALKTLSADEETVQAFAKKLEVELKGPAAESAACLSCHSVGYKLTGGYPAADEAKSAQVSGVGCESCHGPGSVHAKAPKAEKKGLTNGNVTEKMCANCHTAKTSPNFDFEKYKAKGVHTVAAAE